jgi:hypothetical protein
MGVPFLLLRHLIQRTIETANSMDTAFPQLHRLDISLALKKTASPYGRTKDQ